MSEQYLRVTVVREQVATVLLRVDATQTTVQHLRLIGRDRVALTRKIQEATLEAVDVVCPCWSPPEIAYLGPVETITEEEARSVGLVYDAERGSVIHGE